MPKHKSVEEFEKQIGKNVADVILGDADPRLAIERFRNWFKSLSEENKEALRANRHEIEIAVNRLSGVVNMFSQEVPYLFL